MTEATRLEPDVAYDRVAPHYRAISEPRRDYLQGVEAEILERIPKGSRALLDVGAGDGLRSLRLAQAAGLARAVLLDPSAEMRKAWPLKHPLIEVEAWALRGEQLEKKSKAGERFDVITCLWNVLGHVFPAENRAKILAGCAALLAPQGRLFVDVNHRYNLRQYGFAVTAFRMIHDLAKPSEGNGDVTVTWNIAGEQISTRGHVFRQREFRSLAKAAGLEIEQTITLNYASGRICRFRYSGNPLYVMRAKA